MLRRFRLPLAARVEVDQGAPVRVDVSGRDVAGGRVVTRAGPWRSSGRWWSTSEPRERVAQSERGSWDRDEWDVEIAGKHVYRLARDRTTGVWTLDGVYD